MRSFLAVPSARSPFFGAFLGGIGSLPFSVREIAEEDELIADVAIWWLSRPVTTAPCMRSGDVETDAL